MPWQIDPMHTQVEFSAKHFGMMTVRGHFQDVATSGHIDPATPAATAIEITINVASLTTNNPERDRDLRSGYFLELDKHPTITFRSTHIEPAGQDHYTLTGDLTIKGITRAVTVSVQRYGEVNDPMIGHRVSYGAQGVINRKDFGMDSDYANTRAAMNTSISSANVRQLGVAWTVAVTGTSLFGALATTPVVQYGTVYLQDLSSTSMPSTCKQAPSSGRSNIAPTIVGPTVRRLGGVSARCRSRSARASPGTPA
jgi:polyisoprenoid-binding protein YceI